MQDIIMPQPGTIIWTAAVFIVLLFVLKKWAWRPILDALQAREDGIRKDIEEARQSRQEAQEMLEQYRQQLDSARKEAQRLIGEAASRAERLHEEKKKEVEREARTIIEKAKTDIELERQKVAQELRREVVEIAITAASKVIGQALKPEDHRDLIEREIKGLN